MNPSFFILFQQTHLEFLANCSTAAFDKSWFSWNNWDGLDLKKENKKGQRSARSQRNLSIVNVPILEGSCHTKRQNDQPFSSVSLGRGPLLAQEITIGGS